MTETELERMVVRLIGDGSSYQKMTTDANRATDSLSSNVVAKGQIISNVIMGMSQRAKAFSTKLLGEWGTAELASFKLDAALQANGRNVAALGKDYRDFASAMQKVTTTGDDTTIQMLQMAETYGITGDKAKRAAQNAMALAANQGGSALQYMRIAVMLEQGQATLLTRVLPGIAGIKDPAEKAAKAQELLGKMFTVAKAEAETYVGKLQQMKNAIGDLYEVLGKTIADALKPAMDYVKGIAEAMQQWSPIALRITSILVGIGAALVSVGPLLMILKPIIAGIGAVFSIVFSPVGAIITAVVVSIVMLVRELGGLEATWNLVKTAAVGAWNYIRPMVYQFWNVAKTVFTSVLEIVTSVWRNMVAVAKWAWANIGNGAISAGQSIRKWIVDALITSEWTIRNFGDVSVLMWTQLRLSVVRVGNYIEYLFGTVMPHVLGWVFDNWKQVFIRIGENTVQVLSNIGENVANLGEAIYKTLTFEDVDWTEVFVPITRGLVNVLDGMPAIPKRAMGKLEAELDHDVRVMSEKLGKSYAEFYGARSKDLADVSIDAMEGVGEAANDAIDPVKDLTKEVDKLSYSLVRVSAAGSADALQTLSDYFYGRSIGSPVAAAAPGVDLSFTSGRGASYGATGYSLGRLGASSINAEPMSTIDQRAWLRSQERAEERLNRLVEIGQKQLEKPAVALEGANL